MIVELVIEFKIYFIQKRFFYLKKLEGAIYRVGLELGSVEPETSRAWPSSIELELARIGLVDFF